MMHRLHFSVMQSYSVLALVGTLQQRQGALAGMRVDLRVGEIQEAIFEEKSSGFFLHKKSLFPSKSIQNRIIFGSPIRKSYID